ncbi:hypothetical protein [Pelotomaculum propionicicum]|uniref:Uncharacterized protein n=1 Tax=Pelotomaculum propionicicum TaxID=258475 RepID=A0A4Y7RMC9_9FIRM|nr:hypothetical protein [Pelotomaculum propionicicum]TEB10023.1 hypothetical protein Pmgp_02718 [Pelotomaculum propionicicum]
MDAKHRAKLEEALQLINEVCEELSVDSPLFEALSGPICELDEIVNPLEA